jgi:hypothetical protein
MEDPMTSSSNPSPLALSDIVPGAAVRRAVVAADRLLAAAWALRGNCRGWSAPHMSQCAHTSCVAGAFCDVYIRDYASLVAAVPGVVDDVLRRMVKLRLKLRSADAAVLAASLDALADDCLQLRLGALRCDHVAWRLRRCAPAADIAAEANLRAPELREVAACIAAFVSDADFVD